jgi:hypothetical protein
MNVELALSLSVPALVALVGWYVVSLFATRRDRETKRREIRTQHLIEAYRLFASVSNRAFTDETKRSLETAITEIQLLGSRRVVALADQWVDAYSKGIQGFTSPLATALRDELRTELGLENLDKPPKVLRISDEPKNGPNSVVERTP